MYDIGGAQSICRPATNDYDVAARINWLSAQLAYAESQSPSVQTRATRQLVSLPRTLSTGQAFARFGLLLGLFPPAAIFFRMFWHNTYQPGLFLLCVLMSLICCLVGCGMGDSLFRQVNVEVNNFARRSWVTTIFASMLLGLVWGIGTGGAGGVIYFGIGAFFGAACAIPVALAGFPLFAILHRLLARDGMIDARLVWPLAFGISTVIAALILSPFVK